MIQYNPKEWLRLIFSFSKSDTMRVLSPLLFLIGLYTGGICFIMLDVVHIQYKGTPVVHSLIGFIISMLLVFRTNTAYERWWEGRKHWGSLINVSRAMATKLSVVLSSRDKESLTYLFALITDYPFALKEHLRKETNQFDKVYLGDLSTYHLHDDDYQRVQHVPNFIAGLMVKKIHELYENKTLDAEQFAQFRTDINQFFDIAGACERIKKTPIPFSYSMFIKKFIFLYTVTMPFGFITDFKYVTIPIVIFVFYALTSLELIAEEIEEPFGTDENDLPTDRLAQTIRLNIKEIQDSFSKEVQQIL